MNLLLNCCCGCSSHTVPGWTNTTKVDDYSETPDPAGTAPYTRPLNYWYLHSCVPDGRVDGEPMLGTMGFDGSGNLDGGITPGGTVTVDRNGYELSGANVTIDNPCYGWKAVAAIAEWPGRFGFLDGPGCCEGSGQNQTKYTSIEFYQHSYGKNEYEVTQTACSLSNEYYEEYYDCEINQTATVDDYGNVTRTGSIVITWWFKVNGSISDGSADPTCSIANAFGMIASGAAGGNFDTGVNSLAPRGIVTFGAECGQVFIGSDSGNPYDVPGASGTPSEIETALGYANIACSLTDSELSISWEDDQEYVTTTDCSGGVGTDKTFRQRNFFGFEQTITLSGAKTYASVKADAEALLDEWRLLDDAVYPWRTDTSTWLVPLVKRDAASTEPTIDLTVDESCNFIDSGNYTGAIKGAPLDAGQGPHYNFDHPVGEADAPPASSFCGLCIISKGELGASPLPATATLWPSKETEQGPNMRGPGGWMTNWVDGQYGFAESLTGFPRGIMVQKWAETIMAWPALNFARAAGRDRYLFDEQAIACIVSFVAPDLEIEDVPLSGPTEFEVGDKIAIEDGVYEVATKTDAQNYTVGSKLYDLLIPCDGASKLRFPTARALISKRAVAAVQSSPGVVTITLTDKHWLKRNGTESDSVDFESVTGLGTGLTATVVDDYSFTVSGTLGSYTDGTGYVLSTGAPAGIETYDTTCSRKKYVTREWQSRFREYDSGDPEDLPYTLTETDRDYTSTSLANPYIVVISPNAGDTPGNGVRYDFGDIDSDICFGEVWHMDVVQAIADPFWQADHYPCGGSGGWDQAEQPCGEDANHYQYPPLIEASLTTPVGAPTLPVDYYPEGTSPMPNVVGHPNCEATPNDRGTLHAIRSAWETCDDWQERTMHRC